jgi:hypothetical protein
MYIRGQILKFKFQMQAFVSFYKLTLCLLGVLGIDKYDLKDYNVCILIII